MAQAGAAWLGAAHGKGLGGQELDRRQRVPWQQGRTATSRVSDQDYGRRTWKGMLWNAPSRFQIPNSATLLASRSGFSKGRSGQAGAGAPVMWGEAGGAGLVQPREGKADGAVALSGLGFFQLRPNQALNSLF